MQLYNAYTLYQLMYIHEVGWQVPALAMLFFTLGCGNIITTSMTIPLKLKDSQLGLLKYRFTRLDKYFWNHRKRRNSISKDIDETGSQTSEEPELLPGISDERNGDNEKDTGDNESKKIL